ncbi:MAG: hypothetical protein AAB389_00240 [Patescibacteria group bacterium]
MRNLPGNLFVLVIAAVLFFGLIGCDPGAKPVSVMKEGQTQYDMTVCVTSGNNSYIPLNFSRARTSEKVSEILGALRAFELTHPDLEVISWSVEEQEDGPKWSDVDGIWVHHRKVKLTPEAAK